MFHDQWNVSFLMTPLSPITFSQHDWIDSTLDKIFFPCRGQKFHSSAGIYEWILERTSDSSQSARPSGRVLKSAGENSIFWMTESVFIEPHTFSIPKVETGRCDCKWRKKLRSLMRSSVVDCIEVNINFFGAHFHQWNRFDRLYRCNYWIFFLTVVILLKCLLQKKRK